MHHVLFRNGEITRWDHPAIAELNPNLAGTSYLNYSIKYIVRSGSRDSERRQRVSACYVLRMVVHTLCPGLFLRGLANSATEGVFGLTEGTSGFGFNPFQ